MYLAIYEESEEEKFALWWSELKRLSVEEFGLTPEAAEALDAKNYRQYYFDGNPSPAYTPLKALMENFSYCD